jgi:hypothetical protein
MNMLKRNKVSLFEITKNLHTKIRIHYKPYGDNNTLIKNNYRFVIVRF